MKERIRFVQEAVAGFFSFQELCERYGISRKTGYKWLRRFEAEGLGGLEERSRAPHHCPHKTDPAVEEAILELRDAHPFWGPLTLWHCLRRHRPEVKWPAVSTIGAILRRHGRTQRRRRRRRSSPLYARRQVRSEYPHQILTADFKGEFRTGDGRYCYPLRLRRGGSSSGCSGSTVCRR